MSRHYTLRERLALVTPEHLGPEAGAYDVWVYQRHLEHAWPAGAVTLAGESLVTVEERAFDSFCAVHRRGNLPPLGAPLPSQSWEEWE